MNSKKNVLVAGANGSTGRIVVNLLKYSTEYNPVAMVRKQEQVAYFQNENIETVVADLTKDLNGITRNTAKVIFAAGSKGKHLLDVDQEGAKRLISDANRNNIEKFVMLSSMGADDPSQSDKLEDYLRAKKNADEYLRSSGIPYTIVRPGALNNSEGTGRIKLDKKLNEKGEISRSNVAETLVAVLSDDVMNHRTFEILNGDTEIRKAVKLEV